MIPKIPVNWFPKFQIIHQVFFDEEKEDWKVGSSFLFLQLSPSVGPHRLMS